MRWTALVLLAACGDNLPSPPEPGYDAGFDDHAHATYFGTVVGLGPPPMYTMTPLARVLVCVADSCAPSNNDSTFVFVGPSAENELTIMAPMYTPYVEPVSGSVSGDRNLSQILLIEPDTIAQVAAAYGESATGGTLLVAVSRYDQGTVQLVVDGHTVHYLDAMQLPDPSLTSLSPGNNAIAFGLAPGEIVLRASAGHCAPDTSGWPGANPGEIRVPIVGGAMTVVRPLCVGD